MSRNSQRNRANRKKKQSAGSRKRGMRNDFHELGQLLSAGVEFAFGPSSNAEFLRRVAVQLSDFVPAEPQLSPASGMADSVIDFAFESGWQPTELVHATRREVGAGSARLLVAIIGAHAHRTSARISAPDLWRQQLTELGISDTGGGTAEHLTSWHSSEGQDGVDAWCTLLTVVGYLQYLTPMKPLVAVPSTWGSVKTASTKVRVSDTKILTRIRGLLAKAEATTFAAEAEALSEKAQDLMTRYAIDSAVVDSHARTSLVDEVETRRLLIDNPYPEAKVALLQAVADSNGARVIWHQRHGLVSTVGMPVDLDLCELLFTSLLVQATHALTEMGRTRSTRSPSFRRSFLLAFAHRIGERLAEARARAHRDASSQYGKELVPILVERADAVGSVFDAEFPSVTEISQSVSNTHGWRAGQIAAERADLAGGRGALPPDE